MDSWLLKLLPRDMKTKIKPTGSVTPTMDHYPRNGQMGDTDP